MIPVAVKTLSSTEPMLLSKFFEEVELMKKFIHPNIVSLLGNIKNGLYAATMSIFMMHWLHPLQVLKLDVQKELL